MSMESVVRIGLRLKAARERSGLTQQQLADALGLRHRQTIASIEAGERPFTAPELIDAMQALSVDLDYFTDPFRLVGEGQFSFRTTGGVQQHELDQFEKRAGRWIAMYREQAREHGQSPRWLGYKLNLSRALLLRTRPGGRRGGSQSSGSLESVLRNDFGPSWRIRLHILVLYVDTPPWDIGRGLPGAGD